jgi:hypothetical protein
MSLDYAEGGVPILEADANMLPINISLFASGGSGNYKWIIGAASHPLSAYQNPAVSAANDDKRRRFNIKGKKNDGVGCHDLGGTQEIVLKDATNKLLVACRHEIHARSANVRQYDVAYANRRGSRGRMDGGEAVLYFFLGNRPRCLDAERGAPAGDARKRRNHPFRRRAFLGRVIGAALANAANDGFDRAAFREGRGQAATVGADNAD